MAWTPWRKIADRLLWYEEHPMRIPVCYELALVDPVDRENLRVVYVGAAAGEHTELASFEKGERPFSARMKEELEGGLELYYRAQGAPTLDEAEALRRSRLAEGSYPWNQA